MDKSDLVFCSSCDSEFYIQWLNIYTGNYWEEYIVCPYCWERLYEKDVE
jgi:DNA-directed RNA polymerase subunit RPC12/RpoP